MFGLRLRLLGFDLGFDHNPLQRTWLFLGFEFLLSDALRAHSQLSKHMRSEVENRNPTAEIQTELCVLSTATCIRENKENCTDRLFPKMGECREVLGGGQALPSKLQTLRVQPGSQT